MRYSGYFNAIEVSKSYLSVAGAQSHIDALHARNESWEIYPMSTKPSQPGTDLANCEEPNEDQRHDGGYARHSP